MNPIVNFTSISTKHKEHSVHSNEKKLSRPHFFTAGHFAFCIAFLLLNIIHVGAQNPSANKKDNRNRNPVVSDSSTAIEERLVKLALDGPLFKGSDHQNKIN